MTSSSSVRREVCVPDTQPAPQGTRGTRREIRPTGRERTFGVDELIVSTTDVRGGITYANDLFLRVSGYEMDEVVGRPHNLIRHPDMPRAVCQLLWDTLSSGRELFAQINNLDQDGSYYWGIQPLYTRPSC
jgi:PAS domain-containing protein